MPRTQDASGSRQWVSAYLGIGGNLGDPRGAFRAAMRGLIEAGQTRITACSSLYRSAAVGGPAGQPDYLNAVVQVETLLNPRELLQALQRAEQEQGRRRDAHWGPRTLDLDLLLYAGVQSNDPELTLPHPRLTRRRFVLGPLAELNPGLTLPGSSATLQTLLEQLPAAHQPVQLVEGPEWLGAAGTGQS